jgi:hypothetical protein
MQTSSTTKCVVRERGQMRHGPFLGRFQMNKNSALSLLLTYYSFWQPADLRISMNHLLLAEVGGRAGERGGGEYKIPSSHVR